MSVAQAITGAGFVASLKGVVTQPLLDLISLNVPLKFASVANVKSFSGSYTPNNDYQFLFQNLPVAEAPNFLIAICDGQLNITTAGLGASIITSFPIQKFAFLSWVADPILFCTSMYFDGRAIGLQQPQGVKVDYTVIVGQAVIT